MKKLFLQQPWSVSRCTTRIGKKIILFVATVFLTKNLAAQTAGVNYFTSPVIHTIYLNFPQAGYWDSLVANYTTGRYIPCHATIDGVYYDSIGVKMKGNSSFNNPSQKKSFKLDFNLYDTLGNLDGEKKLNLNNGFKDPTFIREKLTLDWLNDNGVYAPRAAYTNVYLNNVLWGLYISVEECDNTFLDLRFGNSSGNLYKGDPHGDLRYLGNNAATYQTNYEVHSSGDTVDWSDLIKLTYNINQSSTAAFPDSLAAVLDETFFLRAWAATILFSNLDSYQGSGHNYFMYDNPTTNKFEWIEWDVNESFGCFQNGVAWPGVKTLSALYIPSPAMNRPLENRILSDANLKTQYLDQVYHYISTTWDTATIYPLIDSFYTIVKPSVYADPNKFYTNAQFETNINNDIQNGGMWTPGLKQFVLMHFNSIYNELLGLGYWPLAVSSAKINAVSVFPNPVADYLFIHNTENITSVAITNICGQQIFSENEINENGFQIPVADFVNGVYFLSVNGVSAGRFVVSK